MIKEMPDVHCGKTKLQLVHYVNDYGYTLKQPARWNDIDKIWEDTRGKQVLNVVDFEPMVDDFEKPEKMVGE
ncbi:MAG: hypothetical protein CL666_08740 [Balneola sp.]|nr:hypothetical protein [Balneola sp.]|tara:strand:+ start:9556 stop:9771 length:216 start_codon:yes stop_codon:yes gene_type:complete